MTPEIKFIIYCRNLWILKEIVAQDEQNNEKELIKLKLSAIDISAKEAFFESAPQLMLQIYIVLTDGDIGKNA